MIFENILVGLDGSKNSQLAAEYAFWIANRFDASIAGQHVVDPRLVDLFIEPEFAEELGLSVSVETSEKVCKALKKIGRIILERFGSEATQRGFQAKLTLSEGHIVEEILRHASEYDLLIVGHRDRSERELPGHMLLGSVAERIVVNAKQPVLIAVQPVDQIEEILVAFDGSEASKGALLMAENFAKNANLRLKALAVTNNGDTKSSAKALADQGEKYLREYWPSDVFSQHEGDVKQIILERSATSNSLLVLGSYGFGSPYESALGCSASAVVRETRQSVLVYRPNSSRSVKSKSLSKVRSK